MKRLDEFPVTFINDVDFEFIVPDNTEILGPILVDDMIRLRILQSQTPTSYVKRKFRLYKLSDVIEENIIKTYIGSIQFNGEEKHIFEMNI